MSQSLFVSSIELVNMWRLRPVLEESDEAGFTCLYMQTKSATYVRQLDVVARVRYTNAVLYSALHQLNRAAVRQGWLFTGPTCNLTTPENIRGYPQMDINKESLFSPYLEAFTYFQGGVKKHEDFECEQNAFDGSKVQRERRTAKLLFPRMLILGVKLPV